LNDITPKRKPPKTPLKSRQFELFSDFLGDPSDLSNTIELWDAIPKYAVSARRQAALRDEKGRLAVHEYVFKHRDKLCRIELQPASIKGEGGFKDYYPSIDEELVEEVIRKVFADQLYGLHDPRNGESWVRFSLQMIRRELEARGKARSVDEIKRSIEILANTTLRLYVEGEKEAFYTSPILSDLTKVTRKDYLNGTDALWAARLPALISKSLNDVTYRQFNYGTLMGLPSQLARWLHKRLSHIYTNAGYDANYEVNFSTLKRDSGLLELNRVTKNIDALEAALDALQAENILIGWKKKETRGPRNKLEDVKYTLMAGPDLIREVKAANARQRDSRTALAEGHRPPARRLPGGR
jgi:hypothetical protein